MLKKILYFNDNIKEIKHLFYHSKEQNFPIKLVSTDEYDEAFLLLRTYKPHIIFVDIDLEGGQRFSRSIRSVDAFNRIPLFCFTKSVTIKYLFPDYYNCLVFLKSFSDAGGENIFTLIKQTLKQKPEHTVPI